MNAANLPSTTCSVGKGKAAGSTNFGDRLSTAVLWTKVELMVDSGYKTLGEEWIREENNERRLSTDD